MAVSRLEAIAVRRSAGVRHLLRRLRMRSADRCLGRCYRRNGAGLERLGEEMVIAPGKFVEVGGGVGEGRKHCMGFDGCRLRACGGGVEGRERRAVKRVESVSSVLAPVIGRIGLGAIGGGADDGCADAGCELCATVGCGDFLEGRGGAWAAEVKRETGSGRSGGFCLRMRRAVTKILGEAPEAANWTERAIGGVDELAGRTWRW